MSVQILDVIILLKFKFVAFIHFTYFGFILVILTITLVRLSLGFVPWIDYISPFIKSGCFDSWLYKFTIYFSFSLLSLPPKEQLSIPS